MELNGSVTFENCTAADDGGALLAALLHLCQAPMAHGIPQKKHLAPPSYQMGASPCQGTRQEYLTFRRSFWGQRPQTEQSYFSSSPKICPMRWAVFGPHKGIANLGPSGPFCRLKTSHHTVRRAPYNSTSDDPSQDLVPHSCICRDCVQSILGILGRVYGI